MREPPSVASDLIWGMIAGAAAVWAMDKLDQAMMDAESPATRQKTILARPGGHDPAHVIANRAADAVSVRLSPSQPHAAGIGVHYAIGAILGATFTALRDRAPFVGKWRGLPFGVATFVVQDEGLNTYLGTGGRPLDYPWQAHLRGLISHGFFGIAVDTFLRAVRGR